MDLRINRSALSKGFYLKDMPNKSVKKRYGLLAVLMHLFFPGLGFLYAGRLWSALLVPLLFLLFVFSLAWSRLILESWGVWLIWVVLISVHFILIPIVFWVTRKNSPCILKRCQHFLSYLVFILFFVLLAASTIKYRAKLFGYEVFILPTTSMANTLLPHDYMMVDTWAYLDHLPKRSDILVFKYPLKPKMYFTKRLIGGQNEKVSIDKGKVRVNGVLLNEPYVLPENNINTSVKEYVEFNVPTESYFVLGDNRDNSHDSRYWGVLKKDAVYGKAVSICFSFSNTAIRFDRMKRLAD